MRIRSYYKKSCPACKTNGYCRPVEVQLFEDRHKGDIIGIVRKLRCLSEKCTTVFDSYIPIDKEGNQVTQA